MDPKAYRKVFEAFSKFIKDYGGENVGPNAMLTECYSYKTVRMIKEASTAVPHRDVSFDA